MLFLSAGTGARQEKRGARDFAEHSGERWISAIAEGLADLAHGAGIQTERRRRFGDGVIEVVFDETIGDRGVCG